MKPFSFQSNMRYVNRLILALHLSFLFILCGCGGFNGEDVSKSGDVAPILFFQGRVQFPGGASGSYQKVKAISVSSRRASIAKAVQNIKAVSGASIGLFKSSDLFFNENLLKAGEIITTNDLGQFSITKDQIIPSAFTLQKEAFIVRAKFNDFELSSLVSVLSEESPVDDRIDINLVSDGAIRFLREEIVQKVGGFPEDININEELWVDDFKSLALELSDRRQEIQQKFIITEFDRNDYLATSSLDNRNAGQLWSKEINRLASTENHWSRIATSKEELKLLALTSQALPNSQIELNTQVRRRSLQLLYTFLEYGFAVSDGTGSVFTRDDWQNLENGIAPTFKEYLSSDDIRDHLDPLLTDADFGIFPIPTDLIEFNLQELNDFSASGPTAEEKKVVIAQDMFSRPWVTTNIIKSLAQNNLGELASIRDVFHACAKVFQQYRFSVERVQDEQVSGGLAFLGELVEITEEFGGESPPSSLFEGAWSDYRFDENFISSFETLLQREEIYLSMIRKVYQSEYFKLTQRSQDLITPNNGYPDPVSVNATRNLVYRNSAGNRTTLTPRVKRTIDLLERIYESIHRTVESTNVGLVVNIDKKRNMTQLIPWFSLLINHSFPLQEELGFYKDISGSLAGKNPRFENLRVLQFDPNSTDELWRKLFENSDASISVVTDASLENLSVSLKSMQVTSLPWLSVAKSNRTSVVASGRLFLKNTYPISPPAVSFPIRAVIKSMTSQGIRTFAAQTNQEGIYRFNDFPLKGDELYNFEVVVKNSAGSISPTVVLSFPYYVAGFESSLNLPDFHLESQYALVSSSYSGDVNAIQPENFAPQITTETIPDVTSGIIPISVTITDAESQPVDIEFSFTSGFDLTVTTAAPRISTSSEPVGQTSLTTFPANGVLTGVQSSASGSRTTFYWHSKNESASEGLLGASSIDNIRFQLRVFQSGNRLVSGNVAFTNFFDLDNDSPSISFDSPLRDLQISESQNAPESELKKIALTGRATDSSQILELYVRNSSLNPVDLTTYSAINTGDNFGTWRIDSVPLELGIENFLEFFARDVYGNINSNPITASILSLDTIPPDLQLTNITVYSTRNIPQLTSDNSVIPFQVLTTLVNLGGQNAVQLSLNTTSRSLALDVVTTDKLRFQGTVSDVAGVSLVKVNGLDAIPSTTDGINYNWSSDISLPESGLSSIIFTAIDNKNNNSGSSNPNDGEKRLSAVNLTITTVDYSAPQVAVTNLEGRIPQTVTTDLIEILGAATDRSTITSFQLCSGGVCVPVSTSDDFLSWKVSLPLQQASTNTILGFIEDQYGFRETFSTSTSSLVTLFLNDITPPSMTVTSVDGIALVTPLFVSEDFPEPPRPNAQLISVNNCILNTCSVKISGFVSDEFGLQLLANTENDFVGFKLRLNNLAEFDLNSEATTKDDLWGTTGALLPNGVNYTKITTISVPSAIAANGRQTLVPFIAEVILEHDGYWPMQLSLSDDSEDQFGKYVRPTIQKREILYFKRDTQGPVIDNLNIESGDVLSGGLLTITGTAEDQLSAITNVSVNGIGVSQFKTPSPAISSPWNRFVTLDKDVSVSFELEVTVPAGVNKELNIEVIDQFGNSSSLVRNVSVFPLFDKSIEFKEQFPQPRKLVFGGEFLTQIVVGDSSADYVGEFSLNAVMLNSITGNQDSSQSFYNKMSEFGDLDYFLNPTTKDERLVISGKFSDSINGGNHFEILRLVKEKSSSLLLNKFKAEGTGIPGSSYHLFRENGNSTGPDLFTTGTLVAYTPKLESVVYVYRPTSASIPQLIRYVNGFSNPVQDLVASLGGAARSTGIQGTSAQNFALSTSQVKSIVVTQVHIIGDSNGAEGVDRSEEYVFLADAEFRRISRFKNINLPFARGGGFSVLPAISLTTVIGADVYPVAMDIEADGKIAYIANETDKKIYKLDISSAIPTLITSFGGLGFVDGKFEGLSSLKGRRSIDGSYFSEIYAADPVSKRISIFTTDGTFVRYFGKNPYGIGGMRQPVLLGEKGDNWFVVDSELNTIDFYSSEDNAVIRESNSSLGLTTDLSSSLALIYSPEIDIQNLTNRNDDSYTTASEELFRTVTQEAFYLQAPNQLRQLVQSSSYFFTANLTSSGRLVVDRLEVATPKEASFSGGREFFNNIVDMELVSEGAVNRVFTLENNSGITRVQLIPFEDQSPPAQFDILPSTSNLAQTSAVGICEYSSGVVIVGSNPANQVDVIEFSGGIREFLNNEASQQVKLKYFDGVADVILKDPSSIDCQGDHLAIADENQVLIFEFPDSFSNGLRLKQEILATDPSLNSTDPASILSGPLTVQFFGENLYVLEKDRRKVVKYNLQ